METYHLQIVAPDRMVFDGQAQKILVRTVDGDVCILPRHVDFAAPLGIGEARVTDENGNTRAAACNGGLISVSNGDVRVMVITFEWEDEIDLDRAKEAENRAEEQLKALQREDQDFTAAEARLKRALTRIRVKE